MPRPEMWFLRYVFLLEVPLLMTVCSTRKPELKNTRKPFYSVDWLVETPLPHKEVNVPLLLFCCQETMSSTK